MNMSIDTKGRGCVIDNEKTDGRKELELLHCIIDNGFSIA